MEKMTTEQAELHRNSTWDKTWDNIAWLEAQKEKILEKQAENPEEADVLLELADQHIEQSRSILQSLLSDIEKSTANTSDDSEADQAAGVQERAINLSDTSDDLAQRPFYDSNGVRQYGLDSAVESSRGYAEDSQSR